MNLKQLIIGFWQNYQALFDRKSKIEQRTKDRQVQKTDDCNQFQLNIWTLRRKRLPEVVFYDARLCRCIWDLLAQVVSRSHKPLKLWTPPHWLWNTEVHTFDAFQFCCNSHFYHLDTLFREVKQEKWSQLLLTTTFRMWKICSFAAIGMSYSVPAKIKHQIWKLAYKYAYVSIDVISRFCFVYVCGCAPVCWV